MYIYIIYFSLLLVTDVCWSFRIKLTAIHILVMGNLLIRARVIPYVIPYMECLLRGVSSHLLFFIAFFFTFETPIFTLILTKLYIFFQGIWFNEFKKGYNDHNTFPWIDNDMVANDSLCLVICVQVLTGVNWSGVLMQEYLCLCWYPVFVCNWEVFIVRNDFLNLLGV